MGKIPKTANLPTVGSQKLYKLRKDESSKAKKKKKKFDTIPLPRPLASANGDAVLEYLSALPTYRRPPVNDDHSYDGSEEGIDSSDSLDKYEDEDEELWPSENESDSSQEGRAGRIPNKPERTKREQEELRLLQLRLQLRQGREFVRCLEKHLAEVDAKTARIESLLIQHENHHEKMKISKQKLQQELMKVKLFRAVYPLEHQTSVNGNSREIAACTNHVETEDRVTNNKKNHEEFDWRIACHWDLRTRFNHQIKPIKQDFLFDASGWCYSQPVDDWICFNHDPKAILTGKKTCEGRGTLFNNHFKLENLHSCKVDRYLESTMKLNDLVMEAWMQDPLTAKVGFLQRVRNFVKSLSEKDPTFEIVTHNFRKQVNLVSNLWLQYCPPHPKDLFFEIDPRFLLNNILKAEVVVGENENRQRHLFFASDEQVQVLQDVESWCLNVTTMHIIAPFKQVLIIAAFRRIETRFPLEAFPIMYILMSRATFHDYELVFQKVRELLNDNCKVIEVYSNFQSDIVEAVKVNFPIVTMRVLGFYWFDDIVKALKMCDLGYLFRSNEKVERLCWSLLSLNLLPVHKISKMFYILKKKALKLEAGVYSDNLKKFLSYVEATWINSSVRPLELWCKYRDLVTTQRTLSPLWIGWLDRNTDARKRNFYEWLAFIHTRTFQFEPRYILNRKRKLDKIQNTRNRNRSMFYLDVQGQWLSYEYKLTSTLKMLKGFAILHNSIERCGYLDHNRLLHLGDKADDHLLCNPQFFQ